MSSAPALLTAPTSGQKMFCSSSRVLKFCRVKCSMVAGENTKQLELRFVIECDLTVCVRKI